LEDTSLLPENHSFIHLNEDPCTVLANMYGHSAGCKYFFVNIFLFTKKYLQKNEEPSAGPGHFAGDNLPICWPEISVGVDRGQCHLAKSWQAH
jgi:hypothetical protein